MSPFENEMMVLLDHLLK